jgi:hypothetical protein
MAAKRIPLKYKIIAYIVTWLVALFATNPNGKYWTLVYMFPIGPRCFPLISIRAGGACSRPASEFILLKRTFISARAKFGRRSFSSVAWSLCSSVMCLDAERCSIRIRNGRILLDRSQLSFPAQHLGGPHIWENAPI